MLASIRRVILAYACVLGLAGCAGIGAWQERLYAKSQSYQITAAIRSFLSKSPIRYYFSVGPIPPILVRSNSALIRNGIVTVVRLSKQDIVPWYSDRFIMRLTPKGRALARKDHWRFKGSGPRGQFFTLRVGTMRFERRISVAPLLANVPWWSNATDPRHCFRVRYSARFVLTKTGYDFERVNDGSGGASFGGNEFIFIKPMSDSVAAEPRFFDAGRSIVQTVVLCHSAKQGWHVVFPLQGVW